MLAQRDYTPPIRSLATLRREVDTVLRCCPCSGTRQRVLLAVNEIIANVLRHAAPAATDIHVDFIDYDGKCYCIVRDDGGVFHDFNFKWQQAWEAKNDIFALSGVGLNLIRRLWPEAFYIPRTDLSEYNNFVLPLTETGVSALPHYFQPHKSGSFASLVIPLAAQRLRV